MKVRIEHESIGKDTTVSIVIEVEDTIAVATALDIAVDAMRALVTGPSQKVLPFTPEGESIG